MLRFILYILIFYFLINLAFKVLKEIFLQMTTSQGESQKKHKNPQKKGFVHKGDIEDAKFRDIDEK